MEYATHYHFLPHAVSGWPIYGTYGNNLMALQTFPHDMLPFSRSGIVGVLPKNQVCLHIYLATPMVLGITFYDYYPTGLVYFVLLSFECLVSPVAWLCVTYK